MSGSATLALDIYGTLIDTRRIAENLKQYVGDAAAEFANLWREKQLEYSFRRGLMCNYRSFAVCIAAGLDYACATFKVSLAPSERARLLAAYRVLPPFDDVKAGLEEAKSLGFRLFAFSNGDADVVDGLLVAAGVREFFLDIVSVDEIGSFKPNPTVYRYFLQRAGCAAADAWLISGNSFDVIGAVAAGLRGVWVRRAADAIFDPWEFEPTLTVTNLFGLAERIESAHRQA